MASALLRRTLVVVVAALVPISGGSASAPATPTNLIAFNRKLDTGIYLIPASGGRARRLTRSGRSQVWSPDGRWIAFIDSRNVPKGHPCLSDDDKACPDELYVIRADGTGERRITPPAPNTASPAWSPDTSRLVVERGAFLYVVGRNGNGLRRLTKARFDDEGSASWSPDGRRIAFQAAEDIYLSDEGSRVTKLTNRRGRRIGPCDSPHWSPDGKWIVFGAYEPYFQGLQDLFAITPRGSELRAVTRTSANSYESAWSPDSRQIAYIKGSELDPGLFTVELGSGRTVRLTPKRDLDWWAAPSWSPDGDRLVATYNPYNHGDIGVWVMDSDGTRKRRLVPRAHSGVWQPTPS